MVSPSASARRGRTPALARPTLFSETPPQPRARTAGGGDNHAVEAGRLLQEIDLALSQRTPEEHISTFKSLLGSASRQVTLQVQTGCASTPRSSLALERSSPVDSGYGHAVASRWLEGGRWNAVYEADQPLPTGGSLSSPRALQHCRDSGGGGALVDWRGASPADEGCISRRVQSPSRAVLQSCANTVALPLGCERDGSGGALSRLSILGVRQRLKQKASDVIGRIQRLEQTERENAAKFERMLREMRERPLE